MVNQYLVKVGYWCLTRSGREEWGYCTSPEELLPGVIDSGFGEDGPLPRAECGRDSYSEDCENEPLCTAQIVKEVRPYSDKLKEELHALNFGEIKTKTGLLEGILEAA
jgi:hypothetical protein